MTLAMMFLLPVGGGGGGADSVRQEGEAMIGMDVEVSIAYNSANVEQLRHGCSDLPRIQQRIKGYEDPASLGKLITSTTTNVVIATTNQSVQVLADALATLPKDYDLKVGYYIQDYEPLFYDRNSEDWTTA